MAVTLFRTFVASACVLVAAVAGGQDRSQYSPTTPTLTERLSRVRNTILGIGEGDGGRQPGQVSAPASRQANDTNRRGAPARPSQSAAGSPASLGRSYLDTSAMTGRRQGAASSAATAGRNISPDQIQHEELPTLARRPSFAPSRPAATAGPLGDATSSDVSRRSLQERLGGVRRPEAQMQSSFSAAQLPADSASDAAMPSSRRSTPWSNAGASASNVQEIVNPTIGAAGGRSTNTLPSLSRSGQTPLSAAETASHQPGLTSGLTSSRRSISSERESERVATAMPARDRVASAAGAEADLLFKRQSPLVSVETTGPRTILIGKEATYTVIVQNSGDVAAQNVSVTVQVPSWADCVAAKESSGAAHVPQRTTPSPDAVTEDPSQGIQWTLPRLEAKSSERLSLQIVPRQSRAFDLAVQWTFTPIASTAVVQVQEPKLAMNLAGPSEVLFGDTKVYTMTLSNPGTGDAENVMIHLSPLTGQAGAATKHQIGTIKAGSNKVIEVELTARQAGKLMIHAAATADGGLEAEVSEEVVVRRAELETKVVASRAKYAGAVANYQIAISNPGNAPAENVRISAQLPEGAKFVAAGAGGQPSTDGTRVQWTIPTIRAGEDARLDLKCQLNSPGANRLAVQSTAAGELSAAAEEVSQIEALADLTLDVVEPKGPIAVGADVVYEIRVKNRGTKAARDVKVVGYFSGKIDPVGAAGGEHRLVPGIVVFNPIASLDAGDDMTFKVTARAKAAGNHMFKAEVLCEAAGAKLGSEHTTLFYGDEIDPAPAEETKPHEDNPRPLVPKSSFEDRGGRNPAAPALQAVPALRSGSAYAPASTAEPAGRAAPAALPVSPFGARGGAKK